MSAFPTPAGPPDFGWTAYTPSSVAIHPPGVGADLWITGLAVGGLGTIPGAVNMITTVVCLRAPGMTVFRMPIFTWNRYFTWIARPRAHRPRDRSRRPTRSACPHFTRRARTPTAREPHEDPPARRPPRLPDDDRLLDRRVRPADRAAQRPHLTAGRVTVITTGR